MFPSASGRHIARRCDRRGRRHGHAAAGTPMSTPSGSQPPGFQPGSISCGRKMSTRMSSLPHGFSGKGALLLHESSQKMTAEAAATLSESTPWAMGMRTT